MWVGSLGLFFAAASVLVSCEKIKEPTPDPGSTHFSLLLTDTPGDYQAVWIDIRQILIKVSSDSSEDSGWIEVPLAKEQPYNLATLRNGRDSLLGEADLPAGNVSQLRIVLGGNNSLISSTGKELPLKAPSGDASTLKLNIQANLVSGQPYTLVLDFNTRQSIIATSQGNYSLQPAVHTFNPETVAAMEGVVWPDSLPVRVMAVSPVDTLSALPDTSGYFKLWGIPAGSYTVNIQVDTSTGFRSDTLSPVALETGQTLQLDTVRLLPLDSLSQ